MKTVAYTHIVTDAHYITNCGVNHYLCCNKERAKHEHCKDDETDVVVPLDVTDVALGIVESRVI